MNDLLTVRDLCVDFGTRRHRLRVLDEVSLTIQPGETLGLVGESGSGKSTLGRAILGLMPTSEGAIHFDGEDITHASARRRRQMARDLQVVFQDPYTSLNPAMTIREILTEPLIAQGQSAKAAGKKVSDLLERVSMPTTSLERHAREFSGGQRQRVAIARALALDPRLIVCDEPVSALDLSTQLRVLDLFQEIQMQTGVAYLFVSHDLAVVAHVSKRIAVMLHGKIVETGDVDQIVDNPVHPYTQKLWAADMIADPIEQARRREHRLLLQSGAIS